MGILKKLFQNLFGSGKSPEADHREPHEESTRDSAPGDEAGRSDADTWKTGWEPDVRETPQGSGGGSASSSKTGSYTQTELFRQAPTSLFDVDADSDDSDELDESRGDRQETASESAKEESSSSAQPAEPPPDKPKPIRRLTLGLDWGTSTSKIIIRDRFGPDEPTYLIADRELAEDPRKPYLLPSDCYLCEDGRLTLNEQPSAKKLSEIKLSLLSDDSSSSAVDHKTVEDAAVGVVALLICTAMEVFDREWGDDYRDFDVQWQFNLGMPSADLSETDVVEVYERIAQRAWHVSQKDSVCVETVQESAGLGSGADELDIHVVPEVCAQVTGYVKSPRGRRGLHFIMDVGHGTLDIASFSIYEQDGDDCFYIYAANVEWLGVAFSSEENGFAEDCRKALHRVYDPTRNDLNPNARAWTTGCPIFLTGGGSVLPEYSEAVRKMNGWLKQYASDVAGFRPTDLPEADGLRVPKGFRVDWKDSHRFSVAAGLSIPYFEQGVTNVAGESKPLPPPEQWEFTGHTVPWV